MKLLNWSLIYLYHSRTDKLFVAAYIYKLIICQREICLSGRERGFHGNAVHKAELRSQTLLYQTLHARWNDKDIQHVLKTVGFLQKYSDMKTPALGFDFETCRSQTSVFPPANQSNTVGGIYFNDILMGCFVKSQTPENNVVIQTSRSL